MVWTFVDVDIILTTDSKWHTLLKEFANDVNAYYRFEEDGSWIFLKKIKFLQTGQTHMRRASQLPHKRRSTLDSIMEFMQFMIPILAKKVVRCRLRIDEIDYCYSLDDLEAGIPVWF
jgi:hypothetical protein